MTEVKEEKIKNGFQIIMGLLSKNIAKSGTKILSLLGSYTLAIFTLLTAFTMKTGPFDIHGFLASLFTTTSMLITTLVAFIFGNNKRKVSDENTVLKEENLQNRMTIEWLREKNEYQVQIASLKAAHDWNKANETLKKIEENL